MRAFEEFAHRLAFERRAVVRLHVGGKRLAELRVGYAEHRAIGDTRHHTSTDSISAG